jgi:hypothetical protein
MKALWKKVLIILIAVGVITGLVFAFLQGRKEWTTEAQGEKPVGAPPTVGQTTNGDAVVSLDQDRQKLIGLKTAAIQAFSLAPEIKAYGRVLDPQPLVGLTADIASARASLDASEKEYNRSKSLFDDGQNASAKALQVAEAALKHDQIAFQTAKAQLVVTWGKAIADHPNQAGFVQELSSHEIALVQLDLPTGQLAAQEPTSARLVAPAGEVTQTGFLGRATTTDHQVQGEGFLFIATNSSGSLTPGLALTGFLQLRGESLRGVIIPDAAIVRWAGVAWAYAQTGETNFTRREIILDQPTESGWFVTNGVAPDERVVVIGAQALLSEERKTEIKPAD